MQFNREWIWFIKNQDLRTLEIIQALPNYVFFFRIWDLASRR